MEIIDNKNTLIHNRGDKGTLRIFSKIGSFKVDDELKFSIVTKGNYNDVVFQKIFKIPEECSEFFMSFTNEEMRIGPVISKKVEYYYEIELNDDTTLIGSKRTGDSRFILYPEAVKKEVSE